MNAKELVAAFAPTVVPVAYIVPAIIMAVTAPELVIWYLLLMFLFQPRYFSNGKVITP